MLFFTLSLYMHIIHFWDSAHTIFILVDLLQLAPFVSFADTLAKAKRLTHFYSVAPLLEKWFACHHFVQEWRAGIYYRFVRNSFTFLLQLAPSDGYRRHLHRFRGRLTVYILFFFAKKSFNTTSKRNSLLPSFLSGGQNRNDDRRKKHHMTLSEESGIR